MVLQGYFDDSGNAPSQKVFVLGGFVAPAATWARFSNAWQAELDREPKLGYFKHNEAMTLTGEFDKDRGWDETRRDNRLINFSRIITDHAPYYVFTAMWHDHFHKYLRPIMAPVRNRGTDYPYMTLYIQTIAGLALLARRYDIKEKCDCIFDEQGAFSKEADEQWPSIRKVHDEATAEESMPNILGMRPMFQKDDEYRPLQAADFLVGQLRANIVASRVLIVPPSKFLAPMLRLRGDGRVMSEALMRDLGHSARTASAQWAASRPHFELQGYDESLTKAERRQRQGKIIRKASESKD